MNTKVFIQNLKCGGCAKTITNKLSSLKDISEIKVNVEESSVSFTYENSIDLEVVIETLKENGYPVEGDSNSIGTKAKSYVSCAIGKMS
jgi:copper chaperone CopZ